MIYPEKIKSKNIDRFINLFRFCIILLSALLLLINYLTTPTIYWSHLCILGFIYIYITVRYSILKTKNLAYNVAFQTVLLSVFTFFIDYRIGFSGWSINISIPILIIISNFTMLILTIINYKNYDKYAISQLVIVFLSLSIVYLIYKGYVEANIIIDISILLSIFNLFVSILLCHRDFKEEIIRKFHI